jgi:hypothetical protein
MTIRNYIKRRSIIARWFVIVWMLMVFGMAEYHKRVVHDDISHLAILAWFAPLAIGPLVYWQTKCPRCGSRFRVRTFSNVISIRRF